MKIIKFLSLEKNISNLQDDQVNLSEILEIQPSILSEVYLWLNLRGENSAILGANVYDILRRDTLILTRDAVHQLEERLK